jgi:hypothetical protein
MSSAVISPARMCVARAFDTIATDKIMAERKVYSLREFRMFTINRQINKSFSKDLLYNETKKIDNRLRQYEVK